ncbi:unnamed protein product [Rotaria magnacalcarata]|uniref:Transposase n=4 Tax=Rotaria magnacalcarata TaxID=392030 RepID=A0A816GDS2_9BILA|nr:unnamed protein product [Rotaria magnacalcarata]
MKDRIQHELKKDSEEFKILPRDKSQSKQFSADWWAVFGIPTQTQDEKCYSMKNYIACIHCKTVYRYSTTFSSTNTLSTSESAIHLTQSTLSNYAFKYKPRDGSDKNVKSKCNELIVRWISNNIRPFSIVDDEGLHELLQFFYELGVCRKDADLRIKDFMSSRYTISRHVHSMTEQTRTRFREMLSEPLENEALTLSPDLWTDRFRQISYLGVTATLIDSLYKYHTITLCCTEFTEKEKNANSIEKASISCSYF